jgi:hypothetical protein
MFVANLCSKHNFFFVTVNIFKNAAPSTLDFFYTTTSVEVLVIETWMRGKINTGAGLLGRETKFDTWITISVVPLLVSKGHLLF